MIRKFEKNDLSSIMQIWLASNIETHNFISAEYWMDNFAMVKKILPQAEIYLFEKEDTGQICGFIGLIDDYIEGIFVEKDMRSKGIGKQLLDHVKKIRPVFRLNVYEKNRKAISFYQREHFMVQSESIDNDTKEKELLMTWHR